MSKDKKTVIDVRTPGEFMGGNVVDSINIPLNEIEDRLDEIKALNQPIVLCCASGSRSGYAAAYLNSIGVACTNGGSWMEVQYNMQFAFQGNRD